MKKKLLLKEWVLAVKRLQQRKPSQRETNKETSGAPVHRRNIKSTKNTKARRRKGTRRRRAVQSLEQNWTQELNINPEEEHQQWRIRRKVRITTLSPNATSGQQERRRRRRGGGKVKGGETHQILTQNSCQSRGIVNVVKAHCQGDERTCLISSQNRTAPIKKEEMRKAMTGGVVVPVHSHIPIVIHIPAQ